MTRGTYVNRGRGAPCASCGRNLYQKRARVWVHRDTDLMACRGSGTALPMLTNNQADVLEFVRSYIGFKRYPPTIREICDALGYRSTSTVHLHLHALVAKTYLEIDGGPRTLRVVKSA